MVCGIQHDGVQVSIVRILSFADTREPREYDRMMLKSLSIQNDGVQVAIQSYLNFDDGMSLCEHMCHGGLIIFTFKTYFYT